MFIAFYQQHTLQKKHHVGMKYSFIKSFIKLHTIGFTQDIFITCQSPRKSLLFSPPLHTVYKRIRLSVFIAISLILSSAVACTQGAASLIITGFIVQPFLHRPKGTLYDATNHPAAVGMATSLICGGRQQHVEIKVRTESPPKRGISRQRADSFQ